MRQRKLGIERDARIVSRPCNKRGWAYSVVPRIWDEGDHGSIMEVYVSDPNNKMTRMDRARFFKAIEAALEGVVRKEGLATIRSYSLSAVRG